MSKAIKEGRKGEENSRVKKVGRSKESGENAKRMDNTSISLTHSLKSTRQRLQLDIIGKWLQNRAKTTSDNTR